MSCDRKQADFSARGRIYEVTGLASREGRWISGENVVNDLAVGVGQTHAASAVLVSELSMVDPEQIKYGRLQIVRVYFFVDSLIAKVVRRPIDHATLDAGASQPDGKSVVVVIASVHHIAIR